MSVRQRLGAATLLCLAVVLFAVSPAVAASAPSAPRSAAAKATTSSVRITWAAPSSTGGSAILGYVVKRQTSTGSWATIASPTASARSYSDVHDTKSPIKAGTTYAYRVHARNAIGTSAASATVTATPYLASPPLSPVATTKTLAVGVTWTPPSNTGGSPISSYVVQRATAGTTTWKTIGTSTTTAYDDVNDAASPLSESGSYAYRVLARNAGGTSAPSAASPAATPDGCPSRPGNEIRVDPTVTRVGSFRATGAASPSACAYATVSDAVDDATNTEMGPGDLIILDHAAGAEVAGHYRAERFPIVVPRGVTLTSSDGRPDRNVIHFGGPAATALHVHGGEVNGIGIVGEGGHDASAALVCTGGTTTVSNTDLDGSDLLTARGISAWPACELRLEHSTVAHFDGPGVRVEQGAELRSNASEIAANNGAGIDLRGTLLPALSWDLDTHVHTNTGAGILAAPGSSATVAGFRLTYNGGSGLEAHESEVTIRDSSIHWNYSTGPMETFGPQLHFDGPASAGAGLYNPTDGTTQPAYRVTDGTRITGYWDAEAPGWYGALFASGGARVDATPDTGCGVTWRSFPSTRATVDSFTASSTTCPSLATPYGS